MNFNQLNRRLIEFSQEVIKILKKGYSQRDYSLYKNAQKFNIESRSQANIQVKINVIVKLKLNLITDKNKHQFFKKSKYEKRRTFLIYHLLFQIHNCKNQRLYVKFLDRKQIGDHFTKIINKNEMIKRKLENQDMSKRLIEGKNKLKRMQEYEKEQQQLKN
ncbi:unnamed protein product [Paramecium sonneborni]|uniref:Uncharacterized protein n=1 Tax=Paramecium sonneborni TaxID=65129 RepID=A0A8S1R5S4_9CILI|nr:unnamed protein product [Paramecium sonneborni]